MIKFVFEKVKTYVSTVIIMAVLTLMLTACGGINNTSNTVDASKDVNISKAEEPADTADKSNVASPASEDEPLGEDEPLSDGEYKLNVTLEGGSGRATIESPATLTVTGGNALLTVKWSSPNYDYMIVNGEKYMPLNSEGNSTFEIPVSRPDGEMPANGLNGEVKIIADTVAMGTPHEIEYIIKYSQNEIYEESESAPENKIVNSKTENEEIKRFINNHTVTGELERKYAEKFSVTYYDDEYCMVVINGCDYYMLNGNDFDIPSDMPEGVTVINVPLDNIDLVSKSTVDYFDCLDALNSVSFSSINKKDSENENVSRLMEEGIIKYAGKYSAPDYELLLSGGCRLVIENTMITHTPDILDQLHNIGINTLIDYSSYESSPIGRMEWIKLYGLLNGKTDDAVRLFEDRASDLNSRFNYNGKKVAYFYISESGGVVIRKNQDYIVKLIDIAGGRYAFDGLKDYDGTGQMTIQKEAFYKNVLDCDVLIYNSTINGEINSKQELISKCEVLSNTKAYKNDNIYCTRSNIYLSVMSLADIADELNALLCDDKADEFFYKLK